MALIPSAGYGTDNTGMHSTLGQVQCLLNCMLVKME